MVAPSEMSLTTASPTQGVAFCQWPTAGRTATAASSSSCTRARTTWTTSTRCSVRWWAAWAPSPPWSASPSTTRTAPSRRSRLLGARCSWTPTRSWLRRKPSWRPKLPARRRRNFIHLSPRMWAPGSAILAALPPAVLGSRCAPEWASTCRCCRPRKLAVARQLRPNPQGQQDPGHQLLSRQRLTRRRGQQQRQPNRLRQLSGRHLLPQ
mmetsp:Transcript_8859/g.26562  ORF Transcript_8859/g.26562 Transcript_8859/m.26562 type:complete len:209 (+) Transcript_8859:4030-4656(+)